MAKKSASTRGGRKKTARTTKKRARKSSSAAAGSSDGPSAEESGDSSGDGIEPADLSGLKDGKLYYRIGEVAQITGVKPYVLRYWESEFRLMAPQKSRSKQRLYRQKDIETILAIKKLLYEDRYTIAGARRKLRDMGSDARSDMVAEITRGAKPAAAADSGTVAGLRRIRDELLSLRSLLAAEI
jgi:DNA-binding transcriptional MerR regulator